jgi:hypothetical protein
MSIVQPGAPRTDIEPTRIELPLSPTLEDIDYPNLQFLDLSAQAGDDEGGFEAAVEWLSARRSLADRNQFEIGWACDRIVARYGENGRDKWARAASFTPGTIGRYWWVAARWTAEEVRQAAQVHPGATFKHFTELTTFKSNPDENGQPRDFEEVLAWLEMAATFNWSAGTLKKKLSGEEDQPDEGKPMLLHGVMAIDEVWVASEDGGKVKKGAVMFVLDDTALAEAVDKATRRGFLGEYVEMVVRFPKDE